MKKDKEQLIGMFITLVLVVVIIGQVLVILNGLWMINPMFALIFIVLVACMTCYAVYTSGGYR